MIWLMDIAQFNHQYSYKSLKIKSQPFKKNIYYHRLKCIEQKRRLSISLTKMVGENNTFI